MAHSRFAFTRCDLDMTLEEFCSSKGLISPSDFGLSHDEMDKIKFALLKQSYGDGEEDGNSSNIMSIEKEKVVIFVLHNMCLWHRKKTLGQFIHENYRLCLSSYHIMKHSHRALFTRDEPPPPPKEGNLVDYMLNFCVEDMIICN